MDIRLKNKGRKEARQFAALPPTETHNYRLATPAGVLPNLTFAGTGSYFRAIYIPSQSSASWWAGGCNNSDVQIVQSRPGAWGLTLYRRMTLAANNEVRAHYH